MLKHVNSFAEDQSSCLTSLRYALNDRNGKRSTYIPRCRNDGTYAAVQCAAGGKTSGCWCVTPDGKPLPDTAATNGRPDCTRTGELSYDHSMSVTSVFFFFLFLACVAEIAAILPATSVSCDQA